MRLIVAAIVREKIADCLKCLWNYFNVKVPLTHQSLERSMLSRLFVEMVDQNICHNVTISFACSLRLRC